MRSKGTGIIVLIVRKRGGSMIPTEGLCQVICRNIAPCREFGGVDGGRFEGRSVKKLGPGKNEAVV